MIHVYYLYPYCKITECDAGRIGPHCDKVCQYPGFGIRCLSKCNCSLDQCDPADGCLGILILDIFFLYSLRICRFSYNKYIYIYKEYIYSLFI